MSDERTEPVEPVANSASNSAISDEVWNAAVGEWLSACVRSSPLSHDVGAWNRLNEVLPRLRDFLNVQLSTKE